jgi:hypothetical protein
MSERIPQSPKYDLRDIVVSLDADRCILDTEKAYHAATVAVEKVTPLTKAQIDAEYRRLKLLKQSFNVVGYVEEQLDSLQGNYTWDNDVQPAFAEEGAKMDLLMPGAVDMIHALEQENVHFGINTYGSWSNDADDPGLDKQRTVKWQIGKISAISELATLRYHIADHPYKTRTYAQERRVDITQYPLAVQQEWKQRTSGLHIPNADHRAGVHLPNSLSVDESSTTLVRHIIKVDDKRIAHQEGDPNLVTGVLVTPAGIENRMTYQHDGDLDIPGLIEVVGLPDATSAVISLIRSIRLGSIDK